MQISILFMIVCFVTAWLMMIKRLKKNLAQISEEWEDKVKTNKLTGRVSSDYFAQTKPIQTPTYFYNHIPAETDYNASPNKRQSQPPIVVSKSGRTSVNSSDLGGR